jgi:hypothetical protein
MPVASEHKEEKMSLKVVQFLVVLAPAIAIAIAGFVIEVGPAIKRSFGKFFQSAPTVEWIQELVAHAAFYGGVIAAILGIEKASHWTMYCAALWFVGLSAISLALASRLHAIEERDREQEESMRFRKTAGLIRSIVRSELDRTPKTNNRSDRSP